MALQYTMRALGSMRCSATTASAVCVAFFASLPPVFFARWHSSMMISGWSPFTSCPPQRQRATTGHARARTHTPSARVASLSRACSHDTSWCPREPGTSTLAGSICSMFTLVGLTQPRVSRL